MGSGGCPILNPGKITPLLNLTGDLCPSDSCTAHSSFLGVDMDTLFAGSCTLPFGAIGYEATAEGFTRLILGRLRPRVTVAHHRPLQRQLQHWLAAYYAGAATDLPLLFRRGTPFQRAVWDALMTIPFGETRTYQWVATAIGRPRAVRAVGQACGANPFPIVIPCHRIVAAYGLGGFSGPRGWKKRLLEFEQRVR